MSPNEVESLDGVKPTISPKVVRTIDSIGEQKFREIVYSSSSCKEILLKLGLKSCGFGPFNNAIRFKAEQWSISTSHLAHRNGGKKGQKGLEIFTPNSKITNSVLKTTIRRLNLIEYKCSECGLEDSWREKSLTLELDHINGISNDNRIENLRFLCPNCHSQTETYAGSNTRNVNQKINNSHYNDCDCGNKKHRNASQCEECFKKLISIKIPKKSILEQLNLLFTTSRIANFYNVHRNTVHYWYRILNIKSAKNSKSKTDKSIQEILELLERGELCQY